MNTYLFINNPFYYHKLLHPECELTLTRQPDIALIHLNTFTQFYDIVNMYQIVECIFMFDLMYKSFRLSSI